MHLDLDKLAAMLPDLIKAAESSRKSAWAAGAAGAQAGFTIERAPCNVGSWVWLRWLEGATGKIAPERNYAAGAWNMTPRQEIEGLEAWLRELGLPEEQITEAVMVARLGYTAAALEN